MSPLCTWAWDYPQEHDNLVGVITLWKINYLHQQLSTVNSFSAKGRATGASPIDAGMRITLILYKSLKQLELL